MATDRVQGLVSRIGALQQVSETALHALAVSYGDNARTELEALRKQLLDRFRNAGIPPEREMEHAEIVGPALDAINIVFENVLRDFDKANDD